MTIQYALTRREIVSSFFKSVFSSGKYRTTILMYCLVIGGLGALRAIESHAGTKSILAHFASGVVAFAIFAPAFLFIRAKTAMRSLTISSDGISTQIGQISGALLWNQVRVIHESPSSILIGRTNGNAFYIPDRAFANPEQKAEFARLAKQWALNLP
ncbi:MAG TPA: YcxB family protein [Acidobacteriaceae bacterium]